MTMLESRQVRRARARGYNNRVMFYNWYGEYRFMRSTRQGDYSSKYMPHHGKNVGYITDENKNIIRYKN